ncbi:SLATT domain-containing protein [Staphylococcus epidermidis]|uniref:SLATT domain-containing protein n=1 Tax=Staphylococcus epidermidis TaxID=1282 RepID=UPI00136EE35D|nr:SLATT domain-containing protein [Staphylococcus epidermidis]MCD8887131.1 SLATT domain-containing protein [Staphylococcus epidermidis]MCG1263369.1 SLATT domain-containing protein [Staphylococcus epidermidis]MCG1361478.1 SLATT domain-containing protein [Staphylococcus epidermidis]MCG1502496.1 SLATT domain-containing protein [Staphylococcus epidermidis]MCG1738861.1 SLATT domain-containing protein [Staphylococcus epidermidis]
MNKDYINLNIKEEINKKIYSIDKVRNARIKASKRLENYAKQWNFLFFLLNVLAVIFVLSALVLISNNGFSFIASCYSLYVILLQYYISIQNYKERALRFHYHQLQLEDAIIQLKILIFNYYDYSDNKVIEKYKEIMNQHHLKLANIENHSDKDFLLGNEKNNKQYKKEVNIDNFILLMNYFVLLCLIMYYIFFLKFYGVNYG